jgi:hypothetical protein
MNTTSRITSLIVICALAATAAFADWDLNGPHKMHFPQLPDSTGWDVNVSDYTLADDWLCTGAGPVQQVHFWISWTNDVVGLITNVHLSIHANIPPDPQPPFNYSRPGPLLWEDDFDPTEFRVRLWEIAPQGWYDPVSNFFRPFDHQSCFQVNVAADPANVFFQEVGNIYWLDIKLDVDGGLAGWKNSLNNWEDDAVVWLEEFGIYEPLKYPPLFDHTLDLSFVIDPTPEPCAGLALLALIALMRRR